MNFEIFTLDCGVTEISAVKDPWPIKRAYSTLKAFNYVDQFKGQLKIEVEIVQY